MISASGTTEGSSFMAAVTAGGDDAGTASAGAGRVRASNVESTEGARGGSPVLALNGELDLAAEYQIRSVVKDWWALALPSGGGFSDETSEVPTQPMHECGVLLVDLSGLSFIDVSGLRVLHRLRQVAAVHGTKLMLVGVGSRTRWLMELAAYDSWWRD